MVKRPSKAPLGSSNRKDGTRALQSTNSANNVQNLVVISFSYFIDQDTEYCQSLKTWETLNLLSLMNIAFIQLCKESSVNPQRITKYGHYPEREKTKFPVCPKNLSSSANWSSLRLQGSVRVIGIMDNNIFYVVFLDKDHLFYLSPKKHT
ncbi:hypothetical protein [Acinetobacter sp.]|jgi:hypothetical protein|uniref:hypothetical protein n=1 Tax=Acinetobacter sp. TaxID=472 RepID=UPI0035AF66B4